MRFTLSLSIYISSAILSISTPALALDLPKGGINLDGYEYWSTAIPFNNVAGMAGSWISFPSNNSVWSDSRSIPLTSEGYPASLLPDQYARSLVFTHNGSHYPTGQYILEWEGSGSLSLLGNNISTVNSSPNRTTYNVSAATGLGLLITLSSTNPADPLRNIRLSLPNSNPVVQPINPVYTDDLHNYGVIRYMDWNATNNHPVSSWQDRAQPTDFHWGGPAGVPYESQIAMSNHLHQDMWVTIPHMADNDYVTNLAQLINSQLDPDLRVWVEYSNEVWNTQFSQNAWVYNTIAGPAGVSVSMAYGYHASQLFDIFQSQLTNVDLIRVVAAQAANSWQLSQALQGASLDGPIKADVASVASYFSLSTAQMNTFYSDYLAGNPNIDQFFLDLRNKLDEAALSWAANKSIADLYGLPLVAYEGGQHIVASPGTQQNDPGFVELLAQINRDPRMGELYTHMFEKWNEIGGQTVALFSHTAAWSQYGYWALKETMDDNDSPKFLAVQQYLQQHLLGDTDGDFDVDIDDLNNVKTHFGTSAAGDADNDGDTDIHDFIAVKNNLTASPALTLPTLPGNVPEPASLTTLILLAASLLPRGHVTHQ